MKNGRRIKLFGFYIIVPNKRFAMMLDNQGYPGGQNFCYFDQEGEYSLAASLIANTSRTDMTKKQHLHELKRQIKICEEAAEQLEKPDIIKSTGGNIGLALLSGGMIDFNQDAALHAEALRNTAGVLAKVVKKLES